MFQKARLQFTCLFAVISICILVLFTGFYLYIAEKTLAENHHLSLQHDVDSLSTGMEQQTVITLQYLLKLEQSSNFIIYLWDNDTALRFNEMTHHASYHNAAEKAMEQYRSLTEHPEGSDESASSQQVFLFTDDERIEYFAGITQIQTGQLSAVQNLTAREGDEGITLLVLSPMSGFRQQLYQQRLYYIIPAAAGCIILAILGFWFTGRLFRPLKENQQKQIQFVSDASHELRTPLAVIRSSISVNPPHYEDTIQTECIHMGKLIDDMLTLTGLENHSRAIKKESVEPDTFLLNLYEQMEPLASGKGRRLTINLPDDTLPRIPADPEKLNQLMMILVQNAISYTPDGGKIILTAYASSKNVYFQVIDNGIGISDKDKKNIFERFYRADSSHSSKDHYGLGLCIAKEIVLAHHGQITVSNTPGGGSTFSLVFPIHSL